MGTNFYWVKPAQRCPHCDKKIGEDGRGAHIGKRSAAGWYCWDCDVTLCLSGKDRIHSSFSSRSSSNWSETCPNCGKAKSKEKSVLESRSASIELGFEPPREDRPTGVHTTSSFYWAEDPNEVRQKCESHLDDECIVDEYGRKMTCRVFLQMLRSNCAIEFTDSVGQNFS
jgi:hypothetical protein